jgi:hypothetical protein
MILARCALWTSLTEIIQPLKREVQQMTFVLLSLFFAISHTLLTSPSRYSPKRTTHGLINYTETKEKCRHLKKKLTCKWTMRRVFIRVYGLEIQSVMLVFWPSFVNCCPSNLLSGSILPPSPLPCVNTVLVKYTVLYTMCKEGRGAWFWASDR